MSPIPFPRDQGSSYKIGPVFDTPTNILVDIETLGTTPGSVILAIGATTFLHPGIEPREFYMQISVDDSKDEGFNIDDKTLEWWKLQDQEVYEEATCGVDSVRLVLNSFSYWLESITDTPILWGNAARFDLGLLEAAYNKLDLEVPWEFQNEMCYRTLKNLYAGLAPKVPRFGTAHNALFDAISQAQQAESIYSYAKDHIALPGTKGTKNSVIPEELIPMQESEEL